MRNILCVVSSGPGAKLLAAAVFLNQREFVSGECLALVDVAESRHEGTDHELCVVVEEVDL